MQGKRKRLWTALAVAVLLLAQPASTPAGFSFYKAKESKTSFVSGGEKITVWQFTPAEGKGPFPGIVVLYGLEGLDDLPKVQLLYKMVAGQIADKGYVVHFVHYFEGSKILPKYVPALKDDMRKELLEQKKDKPNLQCENYYRAWMATVKDGVAELRKQPNVQPERIGVIGFSMGGFLATSIAVEHADLRLSCVVNAFGGLPDKHHAQLRRTKDKIAPILIFGGEEDDIVSEKFGRDLLTLLRDTGNQGEAHFYGGIGHMFFDKNLGTVNTDVALKEALPIAQRFLNRHLVAPKMEKK
jgi:dienelactone hydrolase